MYTQSNRSATPNHLNRTRAEEREEQTEQENIRNNNRLFSLNNNNKENRSERNSRKTNRSQIEIRFPQRVNRFRVSACVDDYRKRKSTKE